MLRETAAQVEVRVRARVAPRALVSIETSTEANCRDVRLEGSVAS
jgi:hypothetical protein